MKITKEHVGVKIKDKQWVRDIWVKVLFVGEDHFFGVDSHGRENLYIIEYEDWELYKEPKRIEAAPAVIRESYNGKIVIWDEFYSSEESAKLNHEGSFIKWPADFDSEKGVWYYEEE